MHLWLFLQSFLAATLLPLGSEPLLIYAIQSVPQSALSFVLVAGLGNTLGGMTGYLLGGLGKWSWITKYFGIKQKQVNYWKEKSSKYGIWLVGLTWLPLIGDPITVVLGFVRTNAWLTFGLMFLVKLGRYFAIYLIWKMV